MKEKFSLKRRIKSFKYAFDGLKILIKEEYNARIHIIVSTITIAAGFILKISSTEWIAICICIALVISSETINSAIEQLCDIINPQKDKRIKKVKDLAAFAVLFCAFISVIVGLIIFCPKIIAIW